MAICSVPNVKLASVFLMSSVGLVQQVHGYMTRKDTDNAHTIAPISLQEIIKKADFTEESIVTNIREKIRNSTLEYSVKDHLLKEVEQELELEIVKLYEELHGEKRTIDEIKSEFKKISDTQILESLQLKARFLCYDSSKHTVSEYFRLGKFAVMGDKTFRNQMKIRKDCNGKRLVETETAQELEKLRDNARGIVTVVFGNENNFKRNYMRLEKQLRKMDRMDKMMPGNRLRDLLVSHAKLKAENASFKQQNAFFEQKYERDFCSGPILYFAKGCPADEQWIFMIIVLVLWVASLFFVAF